MTTLSTTGGRELASVQASETDRKRVRDLLMKSLDELAREKFADEINSGDMLFDKTLKVSQVLSEVYDPPAGAAGPKLTLTLQVEYSALYASAPDLTELALLAMNASLPSGFRAASASEALTIKPVTNLSVGENGSARWTMNAERKIIQFVDPAQVTRLIQGYASGSAQSRLEKNFHWRVHRTSHFLRLGGRGWPIVPFRFSGNAMTITMLSAASSPPRMAA